MASAFTPPPLDSHQGPAPFTPPPLSSHQGPAQSQDAGFFATIGKDIADAPRHFMDFISGHPVASTVQALRDLTAARKEHQQRAADAYHNGDYKEAFHQLMFSIPVIGPPAGAAADEMQAGKTGEGAAHAVEALAPWIAPELSGEGLARVGSAVRRAPAAVAGKVGELAGKVGKVADVATSPVARDLAGMVSPRAAHALSLAGRVKKAVGSLVDAATPDAEAATPAVDKYSGSRYEQTPQKFGTAPPPPLPASPGQILAESQGMDWASLKPDAQASLEAVAHAQASTAEQMATARARAAPAQQPATQPQQAPAAAPQPAPAQPGMTAADLIQQEFAAKQANAPQPPQPLQGGHPSARIVPKGNAPVRPPLRQPEPPNVQPAPEAAAVEPQPPPARTLPQVEAAMAQKAPAPLEPPTSRYTSTGEKKSPQLRAAEITGANAEAKAMRFAEALDKYDISPEDARQIQTGRVSNEQIGKGAAPKWENVTDDLVAKGLLPAGEKPPVQSLPIIVRQLKRIRSERIARELADEMSKSGTSK